MTLRRETEETHSRPYCFHLPVVCRIYHLLFFRNTKMYVQNGNWLDTKITFVFSFILASVFLSLVLNFVNVNVKSNRNSTKERKEKNNRFCAHVRLFFTDMCLSWGVRWIGTEKKGKRIGGNMRTDKLPMNNWRRARNKGNYIDRNNRKWHVYANARIKCVPRRSNRLIIENCGSPLRWIHHRRINLSEHFICFVDLSRTHKQRQTKWESRRW